MALPSGDPSRPGAADPLPPGAAVGGVPRGADAAPDAGTVATDRLEEIRAELEAIGDRPIGEHVAVYERVNAVLAAELSALDEV